MAFVVPLPTAFVVELPTAFVVALFAAALAAEPACNGITCVAAYPPGLMSSIAGCAALKPCAGTIVPTTFCAPGGKSIVEAKAIRAAVMAMPLPIQTVRRREPLLCSFIFHSLECGAGW